MFEIYKPGQGKWTRIFTVVGVMLVTVIGAYVLSGSLAAWFNNNYYVAFGVPAAIVIGMAALIFWLVNRPRNADFLIATESEMKKVSWSSRKEVVGSTKVVIVTTFMLAGILYGVDVMFVLLFRALKILSSGAQ